MNLKGLIVTRLPKKRGETILFGELRKALRFQNGLTNALKELRSEGEISFELPHQHIKDNTVITVCTEAIGPDDFTSTNTPLTGREVLEMFKFNPDLCRISVFPNGLLRIMEASDSPPAAFAIAPEFWARVPSP